MSDPEETLLCQMDQMHVKGSKRKLPIRLLHDMVKVFIVDGKERGRGEGKGRVAQKSKIQILS